ncbi:hypothetical protein [Halobellus rufus]|uniref:hypothetical protein n=1 Tax=Halobellus rufus TaxID=1448860 RepID=UPI0018CCAA40|nr:hypothetical protein [Halobellus rufus]
MDFDWPTYFECAACGAEFPADAVRYDDLGYPECPECAARTGPLASLDAMDGVEPEIAD